MLILHQQCKINFIIDRNNFKEYIISYKFTEIS